jgi:mono/diheme cytochrome c family protein
VTLRRLLALPLVAAALALSACGGEETTGLEGADRTNGKELFTAGKDGRQPCASCHVLADAGSAGTVGPNLDTSLGFSCRQGFDENTIYSVVLGQIDLAAPPMPADLVTGQDAVDVAAYVASVAGKDVPGCDPSGDQGGATTGATDTGAAETDR